MEIKLQNLLSLVPVMLVAIGAISSYTSLNAVAEENAKDIEIISKEVEEIEDSIQDLEKQMTRAEIIQQNTSDDLSDLKSDTKTILTILSQARQPVGDIK